MLVVRPHRKLQRRRAPGASDLVVLFEVWEGTLKHDCDPIYQAWYMRDNNTFVKLPSDTEEAIKILRQEICVNRYCHGMLCATPQRISSPNVHANGAQRWSEFETAARQWFVDFQRIAANFEAAAP